MSRFHWKRLYFAWRTRTWPWRVPAEVRIIGLRRPPEHVFEHFRCLHGVSDEGKP